MTDKRLAVAIEGGDGVGKNSLQMAMVDILLQNGHQVAITNYPQYWFLGSYIRKMLKNQLQEYLTKLSPKEEFQLRAAIYSLDRAISLNLITPLLEENPDLIMISDRGPWSNVLTAAYMSNTYPEIESMLTTDDLSETINDLDQEMIVGLNMKPLLAVHTHETSGQYQERIHTDNYERREVQEIASAYYEQLIPEEDRIETRSDSGWKPLEQSALSALSKSGVDPATINQTKLSERQSTFLGQKLLGGDLKLVGPAEFVQRFGIEPDDDLQNAINDWGGLTLMSDRQVALSFSGATKKDALIGIEGAVSAMLIKALPQVRNFQVSEVGSAAIARLIGRYPQLLELVEFSDGENGVVLRQFIEGIATGANLAES